MRAQIKKSRDLGKVILDSGRAMHSIAGNRGKESIILDDVDTPADNELSSGSSLSLSLSPAKNDRESTKAKTHKRPPHHLAFSDAVSSASQKVRREASRRQNQPV